MAIEPGLMAEKEIVVDEQKLANVIGSGLVSVFSTAMMIAGMEEAAVASVQPALEPGLTTVGVMINVRHVAATPLGMKARFRATLQAISPNGKRLTYKVEAWDEAELIGEGWHERVIVNKEKFEVATMAKGEKAKTRRH